MSEDLEGHNIEAVYDLYAECWEGEWPMWTAFQGQPEERKQGNKHCKAHCSASAVNLRLANTIAVQRRCAAPPLLCASWLPPRLSSCG